MFTTAHFFSSLIIYLILNNSFNLPQYSLPLIILFGIGLDGDILFKKDHRKTPTHSVFSLLLSLPFLLINYYYFILVFLAITSHILLDLIDWKFYAFYPISNNSYTIGILEKNSQLDPKKDNLSNFIKTYFSNKKIITIEVVIALIGIIILITI